MVECVYCKKIVNELEVKYWLDEKFYVQGSKVNYPFCSCDCGTKFYNENNYLEKEVLKNVKGS